MIQTIYYIDSNLNLCQYRIVRSYLKYNGNEPPNLGLVFSGDVIRKLNWDLIKIFNGKDTKLGRLIWK